MSGSQDIQVSPDNNLEAHNDARARSKVDTAQIHIMDLNKDKLNNTKKRHTNTNSKVVSVIGCVIIGFIIYNLVVNYTNF